MRTEVVREDCLIDAFTSDGMLHILQSSEVKERHRIYRPVKERLAHSCTALVSQAEFEDHDEEWIGGSYIWKVIRMYDSCPGPSTDHDCSKEVLSVQLPISVSGESVRAVPNAVQARTN